jgi:predicted PurR-regulated permease PerM
MIALALLFIVIIGLLWVVVQVLQHFFETYSSLDENVYATDFENKLQQQKTITSCQENNKEINAILAKRLTEMEQKFPVLQTQDEDPEMLTSTFKQVLHSSLNLLKETEYEHNP